MVARVGILFIIGIILFHSNGLSQGGNWTTKTGMSQKRLGLSTTVVDGKIYAIGGVPLTGRMALKTVEVYDPLTDTWEKKADMPTARWGLTTAVVDGMETVYAYVILNS